MKSPDQAGPEARPTGEPAIRTIAMPADTNPAGDIFGGWLMSQMDLAAGNAAARYARGRCATIAVDGITFHSPVRVGDEITVWAELLGIGRTSMRFKVSAWRRARDSDRTAQVTEAVFTFVALDSEGRPRHVPGSAELDRGGPEMPTSRPVKTR
jgi:acyl-CoA thioesterase YciA